MNKLIVTIVIPIFLFSQINWTTHKIDSLKAMSIFAADLNGDGYNDILVPSYHDSLYWYENHIGIDFTKHALPFSGGDLSVYAIDLDDDGDVDILSAPIRWWENDGSSPPNFTEHTITTSPSATSVYAIDLDDDGDVDILGHGAVIRWFENDGDENFTEDTIATSFVGGGYRSIYAVDLDDDGDLDVLGSSYAGDAIHWWENDGDCNFTNHPITDAFDGPRSVYAIDLDGDEDVDVLSGGIGIISWWENDGSSPPNFTERTIDDSIGAWCVHTVDLDNDDDNDVLGTVKIGAYGQIVWFENDGEQQFTKHYLAPDSLTLNTPTSVYAINLDLDDDLDVLVSDYSNRSPIWFQSDLSDIHDVGPVSIDIPAQVPEDTSLSPQATIKNFGNQMETFLVTCEIEPGGYIRNRTVNELAAGDSVQITFFQEFTFEIGVYTVTVYTRLGDDSPANDTLEKTVETYVPGVADNNLGLPATFVFNAPTFATGRTIIELMIPEATDIDLVIYDALGRLSEILISERLAAGDHTISTQFDLPAGIYFYKLKAGTGENLIKKFLVIE
jgi:hypothetical protein